MQALFIVLSSMACGAGRSAGGAEPTRPLPAAQAAPAVSVARINEREVEVARSAFQAWKRNPSLLLGPLRAIIPPDGAPSRGLKLFGIGPTSTFAMLGFTNGDQLHTVNELPLYDEGTIRDAYLRLGEQSSFVIQLTRHDERVVQLIRVVEDARLAQRLSAPEH
jgi:hypothetical protein